MRLFKNIFKRKLKSKIEVESWTISELNFDDSDASIIFGVDGFTYVLDLEWVDGIMKIEFRLLFDKTFDTTNMCQHFKILTTVHNITHNIAKRVSKKTGMKFEAIFFKSSNIRNGKEDKEGKRLRNLLFMRYIIRDFPHATLSDRNGGVLIKLDKV